MDLPFPTALVLFSLSVFIRVYLWFPPSVVQFAGFLSELAKIRQIRVSDRFSPRIRRIPRFPSRLSAVKFLFLFYLVLQG